ncbi:MAG: sugar phosphate isomerase/epimerase [Betaproteobacteria bacterium]|nr:MAG: sugar phosphate isomerase/epimerase [Betaproteobacteria bacterium]
MNLRDRIGIDLGRKIRLEEGIDLAARHGVKFIDVQLDTGENGLDRFDDARCAAVRTACASHGIELGLHTASAVNVAEYAPILADAVDRYLRAYIDIYGKLGARWIVVHAGYHFSSDKAMRMQAGLERLKRTLEYAERRGAILYLENLNKEPQSAEVHYLAHTVEEWRYYYERIDSPSFRLSFTANHAHLVPEGVDGFIDALDFARVGEVRLADCFRNGTEVHLVPGQGDLDFGRMFTRIEAVGFRGHYTNAFGSLADMLAARETLVAHAQRAGVAVD